MAVVRCPGCLADLDVADRLLAEPVACGACGTVFDPAGRPPPRRAMPVAVTDDDEGYEPRPRRRRRDDDEDDDWEPPPDARPAYLPGLLSAVVCVLGIIWRVADTVLLVAMPNLLQNNPLLFGQPPPPLEVMVGIGVFCVLWQLVVLTASFRMLAGKNHSFALVGMVMHLLPCSSVCYPFGLALGIWGLIVLNRPEVKAGFESPTVAREEFDG